MQLRNGCFFKSGLNPINRSSRSSSFLRAFFAYFFPRAKILRRLVMMAKCAFHQSRSVVIGSLTGVHSSLGIPIVCDRNERNVIKEQLYACTRHFALQVFFDSTTLHQLNDVILGDGTKE